MAATPPLQITGSPQTPLTPLHGAVYDHESSPRRTSARLRQKRALDDDTAPSASRPIRVAKTPNSTRTSNFEPQSPERTPQRKGPGRRVQIMSPTSPESDSFAPKPSKSRASHSQPFLSANTTLNEGMLPTPVKTPNKKHKAVSQSNITARALFQDQLAPVEMAPSPRRNRKTKRYNGFSLESFQAENGETRGGIQIFTDSRDQVPEVDVDKNNPFIDQDSKASSKKVAGTVKRRKVSEARNMDPQVEEALRDDEGMVYVFRGKKVYRRFDDTGEEEEEIDADDLGLLQHIVDGERIVRPLKTLTRKSIKPTRLFQTEEQKRARELEKEEEAATDIDEPTDKTTETNVEEEPEPVRAEDAIRASRSRGKSSKTESSVPEGASGKPGGKKKGSPFDSWRRVKPGSAASSSSTANNTRGRKRAASESFEEGPSASAGIQS